MIITEADYKLKRTRQRSWKEMTSTRQPGYYRVKLNGDWFIGQFFQEADVWLLTGVSIQYKDREFDEIDLTPINPEPQRTTLFKALKAAFLTYKTAKRYYERYK